MKIHQAGSRDDVRSDPCFQKRITRFETMEWSGSCTEIIAALPGQKVVIDLALCKPSKDKQLTIRVITCRPTSSGVRQMILMLPSEGLRHFSGQNFIDDAGIDVALRWVSTPGVHLGDREKARSLARRCNELAAELVHTRPDRLASFVAINAGQRILESSELNHSKQHAILAGDAARRFPRWHSLVRDL